MRNPRTVTRTVAIVLSVVAALGLTGCAPNPALDIAVSTGFVSRVETLANQGPADTDTDTDTEYYADADDWVVVHFEGNAEYTVEDAFRELEQTEYAADDALRNRELGLIDGNEVGGDSYDIYFVGFDRDPMWDALAPIFADAPLQWTSVELYDGLEDPDPITFSSGL